MYYNTKVGKFACCETDENVSGTNKMTTMNVETRIPYLWEV